MQRLGPVLQFLGCQNGQWGISVLVVVDLSDPPPLLITGSANLTITLNSAPVAGQDCTAYRFDFAVPQTDAEQTFTYSVGGQTSGFCVPQLLAMPSMAYASCNGFSSAGLMKSTPVANALWAAWDVCTHCKTGLTRRPMGRTTCCCSVAIKFTATRCGLCYLNCKPGANLTGRPA